MTSVSCDLHVTSRRNLLLCGSMDRCAYVVDMDLESGRAQVLHCFTDHTK